MVTMQSTSPAHLNRRLYDRQIINRSGYLVQYSGSRNIPGRVIEIQILDGNRLGFGFAATEPLPNASQWQLITDDSDQEITVTIRWRESLEQSDRFIYGCSTSH